MINAKNELLDVLKYKAQIKCACISKGHYWSENKKIIVLKLNHSEADFQKFLNELDFVFDNGYGEQELFGTVWLTDNTWLSRFEYDGSECWEHIAIPEIPAMCL